MRGSFLVRCHRPVAGVGLIRDCRARWGGCRVVLSGPRRRMRGPKVRTRPPRKRVTHYQLESFLGRISPHFHKPAARFIGDMIYGIMVEKDVKLSSVVRASKNWGTSKPNLHGMSTRTVKKRCVEFVGAHSTSSVRFSLPRTVYLRTTPFALRFGDHDT